MQVLIEIIPYDSINRTYLQFTEVGASKNPCSEIYAGPRPFSEPEIQALSEFVKTFENLKLYISFHSYGQLLLFPYVSLTITSISICEFKPSVLLIQFHIHIYRDFQINTPLTIWTW